MFVRQKKREKQIFQDKFLTHVQAHFNCVHMLARNSLICGKMICRWSDGRSRGTFAQFGTGSVTETVAVRQLTPFAPVMISSRQCRHTYALTHTQT